MNKEELDLLENVFTLAIGECAYNDINNIQKLEDKIKTIGNLCKNQKEAISRVEKILNECKLLMPHEFDWKEQVDNALYILNEVK